MTSFNFILLSSRREKGMDCLARTSLMWSLSDSIGVDLCFFTQLRAMASEVSVLLKFFRLEKNESFLVKYIPPFFGPLFPR